MRYVAAFLSDLPAGPVVLTRDGRSSGRMLADFVRGTVCALGRDVIDADVAATPTAGVLVRRYQAAGGIQVSASHNPPEYNGLKLFDAQGCILSSDQGQRVLERYQSFAPAWRNASQVGSLLPCDDAELDHEALVAATVDAERIQESGFHVFLDSNGGAGGLLGNRLLESLGCQVTGLGLQPDGKFLHPPEPIAENLQSVCRRVVECRAHVGFCQDPDADRLAVIDETGRYLGEEYTLALCLDHVLRRRSGAVVANCATSRLSQDVAERHGATFYRSAVGEAHVVAEMRKRQAVFGGEGNGGPIDPRVGYVRDSFVGMALILDALAERQQRLSDWADSLPRYAIHKAKVPLEAARLARALDAVQRRFADARPSMLDGLRLDWTDRWLLVRASNTEPIVRLISEAPTLDQAVALAEEAAEILSGHASS